MLSISDVQLQGSPRMRTNRWYCAWKPMATFCAADNKYAAMNAITLT